MKKFLLEWSVGMSFISKYFFSLDIGNFQINSTLLKDIGSEPDFYRCYLLKRIVFCFKIFLFWETHDRKFEQIFFYLIRLCVTFNLFFFYNYFAAYHIIDIMLNRRNDCYGNGHFWNWIYDDGSWWNSFV